MRVPLLLIGVLIPSSCFAQQPTDTLGQQANDAARRLAVEISLDDARILQVRRLAYEQLAQKQEITRQYSIDPEMHANKMRVLEADFATKLKGVVSEAQYNRYLAQHPSAVPAPVVTHKATEPERTPIRKATVKPKAAASSKALPQQHQS